MAYWGCGTNGVGVWNKWSEGVEQMECGCETKRREMEWGRGKMEWRRGRWSW